jgi:hypothetical protein
VARYDTPLRSKATSMRASSSGPTADEVQNATEIALRGLVPGLNDSVKVLADDRTVGRINNRREPLLGHLSLCGFHRNATCPAVMRPR